MHEAYPLALFFGGLDKLGPGSDADTLRVVDMLPQLSLQLVIDAGCGTGRQTLALASRLQTVVHAVDSHAPFLDRLQCRAAEAGIAHLVRVYCMDMVDIPKVFREIDLLWSEGAAWNIGFAQVLKTWHSAIKQQGFAVVSERSWLRKAVSERVRRLVRRAYPAMGSVAENRSAAREAGFFVIGTYTLPPEAWRDGYYDILEARAGTLRDHPDRVIRDFAAAMIEKISIFQSCGDSFGYVFYVMRKA